MLPKKFHSPEFELVRLFHLTEPVSALRLKIGHLVKLVSGSVDINGLSKLGLYYASNQVLNKRHFSGNHRTKQWLIFEANSKLISEI